MPHGVLGASQGPLLLRSMSNGGLSAPHCPGSSMSKDVLEVAATRRYGTVSPLRYPGGKSALAGLFGDLIAGLGLKNATYIEPYAGGAGAGIALLREGIVKRLVINDIDPAVAAFWRTVVERNGELLDRVNSVPLTVEEWRCQRDIYRRGCGPDIDLGFAFFYLNRTNRSGVLNAGVIGGQDQSGNYKIDARFNRATLTERLANLGALGHQIEVSERDGRSVIKAHASDPSVFMYIDPPYVAAGSRLYLNAFDRRDHEALANSVDQIESAHWLMTYDIAPLTESLYTRHFQCRLALNYSARYPGKAHELLVASAGVASVLTGIQSREDEADDVAAG